MEQNRWKSPVLWTSIVAQVLGILVMAGVVDTGLTETVNQIAAGVLQLLVLVGVLNNPTDKRNW
ncbi:MAG TPA: phage holin [Feifaniaceae bacterium]|nr:phage holin [Feifaniaceae bacterium]